MVRNDTVEQIIVVHIWDAPSLEGPGTDVRRLQQQLLFPYQYLVQSCLA